MLRLSFYGAAETVTGSKYLLESAGSRLLIDCGMFQGLKELRQRNWQPPPFRPANVQSIVLTHAHIDHTGYLPRLYKHGFRGSIYCTPSTRQLTELLLLDSAKNQESDAAYLNRKRKTKHHPALPLYTGSEVEETMRLFRVRERNEWFSPVEPFWVRYHDAGHLLGSSIIELEVRRGPQPLRLVFSGDVGRYDAPLYHDPHPPPQCDYLICESTYGDRDHPPDKVEDQLCQVVQDSMTRGGVLLVPAFAVGRAQQLIYLLQVLIAQGRLPPIPIYLDSPMAVEASRIYALFVAETDLTEAVHAGMKEVSKLHNVHLVQSATESKELNSVDGPAIIISSSGMLEGGRVLFHLEQRLPDSRNTIVLAGYMAEGTRGRMLQRRVRWLRVHNKDVPVRAKVVEMSSLSGHAGRSELLRWLSALKPPKQVFLTHGELPSSQSLADELRQSHGWPVTIPKLYQTVELS